MSNPEEVFKEELKMIKDKGIKDFTAEVLNTMVPEYFWTCAASSSGKYHPTYSLGEGGVVRHVKLVVWMASEFTRAIPLTKKEVMDSGIGESLYNDIVISAAILHDIKKFGDNYDGTTKSLPKDNTKIHGIETAMEMYAKYFQEQKKEVPYKIKCILRGVAGHMGPWTDPQRRQFQPDYQKDPVMRKVCRCVFYGDYAVSRRPSEYIDEIMSHGK